MTHEYYKLYAIYDRVTCEASQPFVAKNDAHSMRIYQQSLRENPNPNDFRLYRIAEFKDTTGLCLEPINPPLEILTSGNEEEK